MNLTKDSVADKSFQEMVEPDEALRRFVIEAVEAGQPLYDLERGVLDQVLTIGRHALDARLGLSPRIGSYLLEEFTQMFCVETVFGQAAQNITTMTGWTKSPTVRSPWKSPALESRNAPSEKWCVAPGDRTSSRCNIHRARG